MPPAVLPSVMCPLRLLPAIDIPGHKVDLLVSDEELAARRAKWVCPEPKVKTGYLARYAKMVTSADKGAVLSL